MQVGIRLCPSEEGQTAWDVTAEVTSQGMEMGLATMVVTKYATGDRQERKVSH